MDWQAGLLAALDAAQHALLDGLAALGLAEPLHGQPAWPFAWRIATEVLAIDRALARSLALTLAGVLAALLLLAIGVGWRRARAPVCSVAVLLLVVAPWPDPRLVFGPAVPTSFHRSPTGFAATSIVAGRAVYERHCAGCHGPEGAGDGPRAGQGTMWPPDLNGALLWRRRDGELLWSVLHGRIDHRGRITMPGFAPALSASDAWAVLDHLQAQAAGQSLRREGAWSRPVPLPDAPVRCDGGDDARSLRGRVGQRLRIVAAGAGTRWREDPRFVTVALAPAGAAGVEVDCRIEAPDAIEAFARIAGTDAAGVAGMQFLADRRGWLRARAPAGRDGWSEADFLCRAEASPASPGAIGVDTLIARMEADPVRFVKGGVPH